MSPSSAIAALQSEPVSSKGTQEGDKEYLPTSCSHPQRCSLRKLRTWKHRILAPDSWGGYQRTDFSEPRLLHLLIHRKAINSLTCAIWFSFINNNLLTFRSHKTPKYPGSPPTSSSFLRLTWDAASLTWHPKNVCWIKQNSTFRWYIFLVYKFIK